MLKILPDIKVYYNGQLVLPSKEIEIFTSDYKDPWIYRVLKKYQENHMLLIFLIR